MPARTVVVIWTLASELSSPSTVAMSAAAHDALDLNTEVRVEAAPEVEGVRLKDVGGVSGVARVTWDPTEHRRARLLCYVPALERWVDREIVFAPQDPEVERGRTLGFLAASVFIDAGVARQRGEVARPPESVSVERRVAVDRAQGADTSVREPREARTFLGAGAVVALPGAATALGAWVGAERSFFNQRLRLGLSGQIRLGSIPEAQASSRLMGAGLHGVWFFWMPANGFLGLGAGLSAAEVSISHFSEDDETPDRQSLLIPVGEFALRGGYRLSPASALLVDAAGEILPDESPIFVHQRQVATWPQFLAVLRAGVEIGF